MIAIVLATLLWFQGAPTAQPRGAITGQIRAMDGSPAAWVRVAALTVPAGNMGPDSGPNYFNAGPPASIALADEQGRYRLENVPAGRYYILAGLAAEPTYYPNATTTNTNNATIVTVGAGATIDNINFRLLWPLGKRVTGRLNFPSLAKGQTATLTGSKVEEFLEVPVRADGPFEFGSVPPGLYLLTTFPPPPGLSPIAVSISKADVTGLTLTAPPTRTVTGRIVVQKTGPIPQLLLSFFTTQSVVPATINPDGTFKVTLHPARHRADVAGMPVGYSLASVRLGSADATEGYTVGNADVSGLVITINAPTTLPRVRGRLSGLDTARASSTRVELTGPIIGDLETQVQPDGSFEFPAVVPGLYSVRLPEIPEFTPTKLVVTDQALTEVQLRVPAR